MDELLSTAVAAARAAAAIHARDRGEVVLASAREKGRADYVSATDLAAQTAALDIICERHPDHRVLAEEDDAPVADRLAAAGDRPVWVVDPLDGTTNFLHGHPQFCASVAVAVDGVPVAGAVVSAPTGEVWYARRGSGAFRNGARIRVSSARPVCDALIGTGFPFKALDRLPDYLGQLDRALRASSGVRRGGSAALDLCYLAQGSLDAFWELLLMPWDIAAGWLLVEEAGGVLTRPDGGRLTLDNGPVIGANSPDLLQGMRETLGLAEADTDRPSGSGGKGAVGSRPEHSGERTQ